MADTFTLPGSESEIVADAVVALAEARMLKDVPLRQIAYVVGVSVVACSILSISGGR